MVGSWTWGERVESVARTGAGAWPRVSARSSLRGLARASAVVDRHTADCARRDARNAGALVKRLACAQFVVERSPSGSGAALWGFERADGIRDRGAAPEEQGPHDASAALGRS